MLIKIAIIGVIVVAIGVLFLNEITEGPAPQLVTDFGKIKDDTVENAETKVEGTIATVTNEVNDIQKKSIELLSQSAKEVTDSTQKGIKEVTDSTQKIIFIGGGGGNSHATSNIKNNNSNEESEDDNSSTTQPSQSIISFETLSLTTTQLSNGYVMLKYEDTSGKTISVTVTLRTIERQLFSGIFYSSIFETFVDDPSNTAYFIDIVIEHQEYGTISSSVYNPRDSPNTIINGVFSQS